MAVIALPRDTRTAVPSAVTIAPIAWLPVLLIVAIKFAVTLAFDQRYGWHRDEFYYLDSGRHLALGYVDYPPITPWLARLDSLIFGVSLVGLRLLSVIAGCVVIVLAVRIARELGGGTYAQILAAVTTLLAPMMLGANTTFETVSFDQLTWMLVFFLLVRLLTAENARWWPGVGVALGVGLMTKETIVALAIGILVGTLLTPARRDLRTPWPWIAIALAVLVLSPDLIWQIQHGWPTLSYVHVHHSRIAGDTSRAGYLLEQIVLVGPFAVPLLLMGYVWLFRTQRFRLLGWACVVAELSMFLAGGKSYYPGPTFPFLFAAGAVVAERAWTAGRWRFCRYLVPALIVLSGLALVPLSIPVISPQAMTNWGLWNTRSDYADEVGWPEFVRTIDRVYREVPATQRAATAILTGNYGEAGSIDTLGGAYGLPHAVRGHLTYTDWKPAHLKAAYLIAVQIDPATLHRLYRHVRRAATVGNSLGMHNEEWGEPIYLCWGPKIDINTVWHIFQHYD
jgi:4-amino-4-deoxy-L-arabinose transferase-like glycosyltransferase